MSKQPDNSSQSATDNAPARPRVTIIIPSSSGKGGSDDVFASVNGRDYLIRRDVEVSVPPEVVSALTDAVITEHITDEAGRIVGERNVPRYPFQVK
ncbi:MAG: hypothetical protein EOL90_05100 [Spartobacteria bacterium]|nr:hypothetical protein [Spartobacteria bacterium]